MKSFYFLFYSQNVRLWTFLRRGFDVLGLLSAACAKKATTLKYGDDQNERPLQIIAGLLFPLILECEWVKGASVYGKGTFPWYRCTATVTNAICEQACCSELPHIYPVGDLQCVLYVCVCVCDWRV